MRKIDYDGAISVYDEINKTRSLTAFEVEQLDLLIKRKNQAERQRKRYAAGLIKINREATRAALKRYRDKKPDARNPKTVTYRERERARSARRRAENPEVHREYVRQYQARQKTKKRLLADSP